MSILSQIVYSCVKVGGGGKGRIFHMLQSDSDAVTYKRLVMIMIMHADVLNSLLCVRLWNTEQAALRDAGL